jgi:hypothetical protein
VCYYSLMLNAWIVTKSRTQLLPVIFFPPVIWICLISYSSYSFYSSAVNAAKTEKTNSARKPSFELPDG